MYLKKFIVIHNVTNIGKTEDRFNPEDAPQMIEIVPVGQ